MNKQRQAGPLLLIYNSRELPFSDEFAVFGFLSNQHSCNWEIADVFFDNQILMLIAQLFVNNSGGVFFSVTIHLNDICSKTFTSSR